MAFPQIVQGLATNGSSQADPYLINLPATVEAGELLIAFVAGENSPGLNFPLSGWTNLFTNSSSVAATANPPISSLLYRWADGSEGGGTLSIDISLAAKFTGIVWRISGARDPAVETPKVSSMANNATDNASPDPPNFTPAGGAKDWLWFWLAAMEGEQTSPPAGTPTNYENPIGANTGTAGAVAGNHRLAAATRENNAASEDPPIWTISAADAWMAWTLAIPPAPPVPQPTYTGLRAGTGMSRVR